MPGSSGGACGGASSSRWSVARRRGRSPRVRSSPSGCGASACSLVRPRAIRTYRPVSRHFCRRCNNWAGLKAATYGSNSLGRGQCRQHSQTCGGIGRPRTRCDPGQWRRAAVQLLQATRTVPIVFVIVPDPVGAGLVESLSRPGGNATGFMQFEYSLTAKWPELLKEIAPGVKRAAVLRDAATTSGIGQFAVIQYVAPSVGVEVSPIDLRDPGEIERAVTAFARSPDGGLIMTAGSSSAVHRNLIIALAARHKLPAVYSNGDFVAGGGLISYGPNFVDQYRRAAATSIASSRARSPLICRCKRRPSTSWSSTSRPPRRSASPCRHRCSPAPTR